MKVVKHSHKEEKTKKICLLYVFKTFNRKKDRNPNEGKLGQKTSIEKEKNWMSIPPDVAEYVCLRYRRSFQDMVT